MYTKRRPENRWRLCWSCCAFTTSGGQAVFLHQPLYRHIVPTLVKDMNNVCPETEIVPVITNLNGVLTYEDIARLPQIQRLL